MEVEEKPKEEYSDVGGLDKQIEVRIRVSAGYVALGLSKHRWRRD